MPVMPGAEPFAADGGPVGVVLCHGFTGSPQSMRPWACALADAGLTVRLPRLPGHGTSVRELNMTGWPDWLSALEREFLDLRDRCEAVFVMGLSVGATLGLRLAEIHGDEVAGVVVVNVMLTLRHPLLPLLPLVKHLMPTFPGVVGDIKKPGAVELGYDRVPLKAFASLVQLWSVTHAELDQVRQPILVCHSRVDNVLSPESGRLLADGIASTDVTDLELPDSFHVATLDNDALAIFAASLDFVRRIASAPPRAS